MNRSINLCAWVLVCACSVATWAAEGNWPSWRGPAGTGVAEGAPPLTWGEDKNVKWKIDLPGKGLATPIVWGDLMFIQTAIDGEKVEGAAQPRENQDEGERRGRRGRGRGFGRGAPPDTKQKCVLIALNRHTGKEAWRVQVKEELPHEGTHRDGTFASGSPVTDGTHIYAFFGSRGLHCVDMKGNVIWSKDLGKMRVANSFGEGASPALHGDTLVVNYDHEGDSFIVALDKKTGDQKWKVTRDERTTWTTPLIVEVGGSAQVIVPGSRAVRAYDLKSGEVVWQAPGLTANVIPSPVYADGIVYVMSGFRGAKGFAIRLADAKGEMGEDHKAILWSVNRSTPYVPSPVVYNQSVYFLASNNGVLSVLNAKTGQPRFDTQRLEGIRGVYSSPVASNGHVYITSRDGATMVLKAGDEFKVVATNKLDDDVDASLVIIGDCIYIRGRKSLYCISSNKKV